VNNSNNIFKSRIDYAFLYAENQKQPKPYKDQKNVGVGVRSLMDLPVVNC